MKIDNDFKNLLPELTAEEYTGLERDIVKHGILSPIIVWNDTIVDGHNRYAIAQAHRFPESAIPTKEINFDSKASAMQWIVDNQFAKRNLEKSERMRLLMKIEEQIAKEAATRTGGRPKKDSEKPASNLTEVSGETAEIMAKKMGVSKNTYKDMKTIIEKGTPEQIARMDKGGKGNGVSAIAKEIKGVQTPKIRKCRICGVVLSEENTFPADWQRHSNICKKCHRQTGNASSKALSDKYENMLIENDNSYSSSFDFESLEDEIVNIVSSAMDSVFSSLNNYKEQGVYVKKESIENIRQKFSMLIATMKEMERQNA